MTNLEPIRAGSFYLHSKGGVYLVTALAKLEADETPVVVYSRQLQDPHLNALKGGGQVWVRSEAEFQGGRFTLISPHDAKRIAGGEATAPTKYVPESDEMRCPQCWTSADVHLGDMFLSGLEADCGNCGAHWLWFGRGGDE